ncbi:hypothetical protein TYRP_013547 [Tyrophagus putrescentiae]|nr:hypothetical protein TYRP_013547 [Tyrophagus putrescentiae]
MRTSEELYSEVIQLRQTVSQCLEFKRILQKIFDTKDTVTANDSIKKYYPHFQGAHLKFTVKSLMSIFRKLKALMSTI